MMKQKDKTITSGSDAGGGVGFTVPADMVGASASGDTTAPANSKAVGRVKLTMKRQQAAAMIEAAVRGVVRSVLEGIDDETPDDTITPLAIPAPVPAMPPENVKDKSAVRATVGETGMADAEIRADGTALPIPVHEQLGRPTSNTRGTELALNIQEPPDLDKLAEYLRTDVLESEQDAEMENEPDNSIPPGHPKPGQGEYTTSKMATDDEMNKAIEPGNVPSTVPNYRPAPRTDKACKNCRFFQPEKADAATGECTAYDFVAMANYLCDSWQPQAQADPVKSAPMRVGSKPAGDVVGGEVVNNEFRVVPANGAGIATGDEYSYEETPELARSHGREKAAPMFLPADRVYSKSLNSLGEVVKSEFLSGIHIYTIKLIDRNGLMSGSAWVQQSDLTPRSMRAIKRLRDSTVKSDDAKVSIEQQINGLTDQLKTICAKHGDFKAAPIPVARLQTVESTCKDILRSPDVQSVATDTSFRKYIRAVQDVQHAMSAAVHLIEGARQNATEETDPTQKDVIWYTGQKNALDRCKDALERSQNSLLDKVPMRTIRQRVFRDVDRE